jgi:hypothetical protein
VSITISSRGENKEIYKMESRKNEYHRTDLPEKLYKAFPKKEYAEEFIEGVVFFRSIQSLRKIESAGADPSEGRPAVEHGPAKVTIKNNETGEVLPSFEVQSSKIGFSVEAPERRFVSCFSAYSEAPRNSKFGRYIVEIHDVSGMISAWQSQINHLEYGNVCYFDPSNVNALRQSPDVPAFHLKDKKFLDEVEFRISFEASEAYLSELAANVDPSKYGVPRAAIPEIEALTWNFSSNKEWMRLRIDDA